MLGLCYKRLQLAVARSCSIAAVDSMNHFHCSQNGPLFISSFSSKSILLGEAQTHDKDLSFTVSYLISSFGFSPEIALSVSKKQNARFNSPENPNSVIQLLKNHGFSDAHISKIVMKLPRLLLFDAENNLLLKFEFLSSIGVSGTALVWMLCQFPNLLCLSLERRLKPYYDISTTLGIPKEKLPQFFITCGRIFKPEELSNVVHNVSILRAHDVPESSFQLWASSYLKALSFDSDKVKGNVKKVISMGFCPSSGKFMRALYVISVTNASKWEQKMEFYRNWGWTENDVLLAFRKSPMFINFNEKNISEKMDFYLNKMGLQPADVAARPDILTLDLEKRIMPRCSVVIVIQSKGLYVGEDLSLNYILRTDKFMDRFVLKYQEEVPELLSISQGKMCLADLGLEFDGRGGVKHL